MEARCVPAARTERQRLQDQLDSVHAWHLEARDRTADDLALITTASREVRMDARRRLDVLQRAQTALLARADAAVEASQAVLRRPALAVIAHRNEWLRTKLELALRAEGVEAIAIVDDGADALGVTIAEQPDLLVVEDRLPSFSGLDLVREVRRFAAHTVIATQVEGLPPERMVEAGASAVFSRRVPPALIAEELAAFLRTSASSEPTGPLVVV